MNLTQFKKIASYLPELSIITVASLWFLDNLIGTRSNINYFMIAIIALILILMLWRNKIYAIIISIVLGWTSFYMVFAVISEFREYPSGDPDGIKLLVIGLLVFLGLCVTAGFMPMKYMKQNKL